MKLTISGSQEEIKNVLQAIASSSKHMELIHGFSSVTPNSVKIPESEDFEKKVTKAISPKDQTPLQ